MNKCTTFTSPDSNSTWRFVLCYPVVFLFIAMVIGRRCDTPHEVGTLPLCSPLRPRLLHFLCFLFFQFRAEACSTCIWLVVSFYWQLFHLEMFTLIMSFKNKHMQDYWHEGGIPRPPPPPVPRHKVVFYSLAYSTVSWRQIASDRLWTIAIMLPTLLREKQEKRRRKRQIEWVT